jgi:hypothetical protein
VAQSPKHRRAANGKALVANLLGSFRDLLARGAGKQYRGNRDVYATAGYVPEGGETFEHYLALYERDPLAGQIVEQAAKTTWKTPPEIVEEGKPGGTRFTKAFVQLAHRLDLWREFETADVIGGIGRYGVLLIGMRGSQDLKTPVTALGGPDDVVYLKGYDEGAVRVASWVKDVSNARFGLPESYEVQSGAESAGFPTMKAVVHASRCLHVAENARRDRTYGRPRLKRVLNLLNDLQKITASTGESYWQRVVPILQAVIDPSADITSAQQDTLRDALAAMPHDLRRQFIGQGVKLESVGADSGPNPQQVVEMFFSLFAAACGIPKRILFGNEAGDLASSMDQASYFGMINERQEHFAEPQLVRAFIDKLLALRALPAPATGKYIVQWPTLFELTELEQADANLKRAQTAAALTPMGGDPLSVVEITDERDVWLVPKKAGAPAGELPPVPPEGE